MQALTLLVLAVALGAGAASAGTGPITDLEDGRAKVISLTGDWLASGAGAVWLSDPPGNQIYRLHPQTGLLVKKVAVPQGPCEATGIGFGAVWTATCRTPGLARIDPKTNRVSRHVRLAIPSELGGEGSVSVGAGAVWLVVDGPGCPACRLARVDPVKLRVAARIPVEPGSAAVRVGSGAIWVTNPGAGIVQKVDPRSNRVVRTTKAGLRPRFFAVGAGGVWTLNQTDGSVTRINPRTGAVVARIAAEVAGDGGDMTTGAGWVWARGRGYLLTRIDPRTNAVVERYGPSSGSGAVIVGFGAVWISAHDMARSGGCRCPSPEQAP